ncbi:MAG TPA: MFS transporter [Solirubrobacterales bacterium]|nr:MFS transporter [Solirubrobacterales bacterium]
MRGINRPLLSRLLKSQYSRPRSGWPVIVAYSLVCAGTQLLWLTYAPIDTGTAHYYGVSVSAVGWLAEIFPLLYVVLAIPAGRLLDSRFRPSLAAGAALMAAGGLLRLGGQTFAWAMAGQVAVAVAQPVVLSAMGKVAGDYLPAEQRPAGIAVASAGSFAGMLFALILGPTLGAHGHVERLLVFEAALSVLAALALILALRRPGEESEESAAIEGGAARALWGLPAMRTMCGLVFVGFGVFVALATWLQTLLHPAGVSEQSAGVLLVGMVVAGIVGCAVLPPLLARRGAERAFMLAAVLTSALGCAALAAVSVLGARAGVVAVMGFVMLPALPVVLTTTERLSGSAAGTAGAIVWMAGNLGGLVVALIVQVLVHDPAAAFLAMATVSLLGVPLALRFPQLARLPARDALAGKPAALL